MRKQFPTTHAMTITQVQHDLLVLVDEVSRNETRVVVEQAGAPVAALVSVEDLRQLAEFDAQRAERRRVLNAIREKFRDVPAEEIEQEAEKAVAEVRAEMRAERQGSARA